MKTNLFELIKEFDTHAAVPALRAIAHSSLRHCIGAIYKQLRGDETPATAEQVTMWHGVYALCFSEVGVRSKNSIWGTPLKPAEMLSYMTKKPRTIDDSFVDHVSKVTGLEKTDIAKMHEQEDEEQRERLLKSIPAILGVFELLETQVNTEAFNKLPTAVQHQLGLKVIEALHKANDNILSLVFRPRKISALNNLPFIEQAIEKTREWVQEYEAEHKDELTDVRTLQDVA